jgi:hypothetical protein
MKWHLMCLFVLLVSFSPAQTQNKADGLSDSLWPQVSAPCTASRAELALPGLLSNWQAVVWVYGALGGRVTTCGWRLAWRTSQPRRGWPAWGRARRRRLARDRWLSKPGGWLRAVPRSPVTPSCWEVKAEQTSSQQIAEWSACQEASLGHPAPTSAGGSQPAVTPPDPPPTLTAEVVKARTEPASATPGMELAPDTSASAAAPVVQKTIRHRSSQVLRPGVLLTGHGLQLRPFIAQLGDTLDEYTALWADHERFVSLIEPLLKRRCALCGGETGFRRFGSDKRTLILPGQSQRTSFRVQKIQCCTCQRITRILPTFCAPYEQHHLQTIQNALENCWRRNTSYRDTTGILNQSRPADGQYVGHTLPYEWTLWLGGTAIHLPQLLVWLGLRLPRHGLLDEFFLEQDKGPGQDRRIFAVTLQDAESEVIWNILRVDHNNTDAFKDTLQQLKAVEIQLRALTTDGWQAILRAVREELSEAVHLLCHFHAKQNVFETLEKYRRAKHLPKNAPELADWQRAFSQTLPRSLAPVDAPRGARAYPVSPLPVLAEKVPLLYGPPAQLPVGCHYQPHRADLQIPHPQSGKSVQLPTFYLQRGSKVTHHLGSGAQLYAFSARR